MIEVKELTKHYGEKKAVDSVSFTVNDGEILGFLGPNGAGKSTTMNMLTGYISSTSGTAVINGVDILEDPIAAKKNIGYLPEIPPLYIDMTVKAYLNFVYDLKKCKLSRKEHLRSICDRCKITDVKDRIIKHLSKGYRQRVGLAQALVGNPPVLILDEPTVGLDPNQMIEIRNLIKNLGKHHTVILSSHILSEVQQVCDRVVIISAGKVAADDTADNLSKKMSSDHRLTVRIEGDRDEVSRTFKLMDGMKYVNVGRETEPGVFEYVLEARDENTDLRRKVSEAAQKNGYPILMMNTNALSLEDIFFKITQGETVGSDKKSSVKDKPEEKKAEKEDKEKEADE